MYYLPPLRPLPDVVFLAGHHQPALPRFAGKRPHAPGQNGTIGKNVHFLKWMIGFILIGHRPALRHNGYRNKARGCINCVFN